MKEHKSFSFDTYFRPEGLHNLVSIQSQFNTVLTFLGGGKCPKTDGLGWLQERWSLRFKQLLKKGVSPPCVWGKFGEWSFELGFCWELPGPLLLESKPLFPKGIQFMWLGRANPPPWPVKTMDMQPHVVNQNSSSFW